MQTNHSVQLLIDSDEPREVAKQLEKCATHRAKICLKAIRDNNSEKERLVGCARLAYAFGGGYLAAGGHIYSDGLRKATNEDLNRAKISRAKRAEYDKLWCFKPSFLEQHGEWVSERTILGMKKGKNCYAVSILYSECRISGLVGGNFNIHHISKGHDKNQKRLRDFFIGILHRDANRALKVFKKMK